MNRLLSLLFICLSFSSCSNNRKQLANESNISNNGSLEFDEIILSTSSCMMPCPMVNIIINSNGDVVFKGQGEISKKGLFTGKVSEKYYRQLENGFKKINFDSLKSKYESQVSDQRTITTTFLKNGMIYKTVYDYGTIAPELFRSGYAPVENLYRNVRLKKIPNPTFIPSFEYITESKLKRDSMVLDVRQSETFLLMDYLRKGKISDNNFQVRFRLHTYFDINSTGDMDTDGRFYKFLLKGKSITIDIGFNFFDVNAKNWQWRKAGEYD